MRIKKVPAQARALVLVQIDRMMTCHVLYKITPTFEPLWD